MTSGQIRDAKWPTFDYLGMIDSARLSYTGKPKSHIDFLYECLWSQTMKPDAP